MKLQDFLPLLLSGGVGAVLMAIVIGYFLSNPDKLIKWISSGIYLIYGQSKKKVIATSITESLNQAIYQLRKEIPTVVTNAVRLKWIKNADDFAELADGEVVIYVNEQPDKNKIMVVATMQYLQKGLIAASRPYVDRKLLIAIDVTLAQRILLNQPEAYEYLQTKYVDPLREDQRSNELYNLTGSLDGSGVLTRIILLELSGLSRTTGGRPPTSRIRGETVEYTNFVSRIIERENEYAPLRYYGKHFSSTIALVAQPELIQTSGIAVYKRQFQRDIEVGVRTIHLLARGIKNIQVVRTLAVWARNNDLIRKEILRSSFYEPKKNGLTIPAVCITCFSNKSLLSVEISPVDELASALAEIVPEVAYGQIEIVRLERESGVRAKVVVRSLSGENPIHHFIGTNGSKIEQLKAILSTEEEIDFILWSASPRELIERALYPLKKEEFSSIDVNIENATAKVVVKSKDLVGLAVGSKGNNIRLASQVTGFKIEVESEEDRENIETKVRQTIEAMIAPINLKDIEIKKLAYHEGGIVKCFVSSVKIRKPETICKTLSDEKKIDTLIQAEIHYLPWSDDDTERVTSALYPLNPQEITYLSIDKDRLVVKVEVNSDNAIRSAIGLKGRNVQAAERLTGYRINIISDR